MSDIPGNVHECVNRPTPLLRADPEPTKRPAPMEPPMAIIWRWRGFMVAFRLPIGPLRRLKDSRVKPLRVQKPNWLNSVMSGPRESLSESSYAGAASCFSSGEDEKPEYSGSFL